MKGIALRVEVDSSYYYDTYEVSKGIMALMQLTKMDVVVYNPSTGKKDTISYYDGESYIQSKLANLRH